MTIEHNPQKIKPVAADDATSQFALQQRQAKALAASGVWPHARDVAKAIAVVMIGADLGISPTRALMDIHVVKGKPVLGYTVIAALIKKSGRYRYKVLEHTDEVCRLEWFEKVDSKWERVGESSFSLEDARRAGLTRNPTWKAYTRDMVIARAISRGARWFCADALGGSVYVEGELQSTAVHAEVVDAEVVEPVKEVPALPAPEGQDAWAEAKAKVELALSASRLISKDQDTLLMALLKKGGCEDMEQLDEGQLLRLRGQIAKVVTLGDEEIEAKMVKMRAYLAEEAS